MAGLGRHSRQTRRGLTTFLAALGMMLCLTGRAVAAGPWAELGKFTASDGAADDDFGFSTSMSGSYAVVGAQGDNPNGNRSGSAYVYHRTGTTWDEITNLTASDGVAGHFFGYSVAISGDYAIVGAYGDNDKGRQAGAAYVYHRTGTTWDETKLKASDGAFDDEFGGSVAIDGDYAIVGAWMADSAYIYHRTGSTWTETRLAASDGTDVNMFGRSVSISGDYAVVGAPVADGNDEDAGAIYVYKRTGSAWNEVAKLAPPDGVDSSLFGWTVSINGDYIITSAVTDSENGFWAGAAYVFERNGAAWDQVAKLTASQDPGMILFGASVAIDANYALVSAQEADANGIRAGAAYVYERNDTGWDELVRLTASDGVPDAIFGRSIALGDNQALIGAPGDDDNGLGSGSVYVFNVPEPATLSLLTLGALALVRRRRGSWRQNNGHRSMGAKGPSE